jgi:hypothetical protein
MELSEIITTSAVTFVLFVTTYLFGQLTFMAFEGPFNLFEKAIFFILWLGCTIFFGLLTLAGTVTVIHALFF